jgi:hypothetical protein
MPACGKPAPATTVNTSRTYSAARFDFTSITCRPRYVPQFGQT